MVVTFGGSKRRSQEPVGEGGCEYMHRLFEWCSFAAHLVTIETVVAKVRTGAHIAADVDRIDFSWLGWRPEHQNEMIRTLLFLVAVSTTDVAIDKTICSSSPELRRAICLNMTTLLAPCTLHNLGTRNIEMIIDNRAMFAGSM